MGELHQTSVKQYAKTILLYHNSSRELVVVEPRIQKDQITSKTLFQTAPALLLCQFYADERARTRPARTHLSQTKHNTTLAMG